MEGWISEKLGVLFETGSGTTPQSSNANYYGGNINWLLTGDLNDGIITDTSKKITVKALSDFSTLKMYPKRSVVIALYGATIGKLGLLEIESTTNQACCVLFNSKRMQHDYLFYNLLFSKYRILALSVGGGQPNISQNIIKNFVISFPSSIPEQRKIATILNTIDLSIIQTEQLIAKYKNIKQGLLHDLLTFGIDENGTIRNPGTYIFVKKKGLITHEDWEVVEINDISSIGNGRDYKHLKEGNIPVFGSGGYMTSVNDYLYDGDTVCIGRKGTIDLPQYHSGKIWTVDTLFYTHSFSNILPKFLFYIFQTINWKKYNEATGVPSLSKKTISKIKISIPAIIEEQQKIITIIEQQDFLIDSEQTNLAKLQKLKQGLMSDLLTGKIRVKI